MSALLLTVLTQSFSCKTVWKSNVPHMQDSSKLKVLSTFLAVHFYYAQSSNVWADNHLNVSYFSHAYVITQKVHAKKKQMVTDGEGWIRWFWKPRKMHFCNSVKIKIYLIAKLELTKQDLGMKPLV